MSFSRKQWLSFAFVATGLTLICMYGVFALVTMIRPPDEKRPPNPNDDPITVWLKESTTPTMEEIWLSVRLTTEPLAVVTTIYSNNEVRNAHIAARRATSQSLSSAGTISVPPDAPYPERVYRGYISPDPIHQHDWNIGVDEPNVVVQCVGPECKILELREGYLRDANNKIISSDHVTPRNPPPSYFDHLPILVYFATVIVALGFVIWWFKVMLQRARDDRRGN